MVWNASLGHSVYIFIFLSEAEVLQLYCLRQTAKLGITLDCGENGMIEIVFTRA